MIDISEKYTASLVLGSGGARGLAHIGIIEWLLENNFDIRSISGSSIGALIGGIYAAGKLDIYKNWALALERRHVISLLDLSFGRSGLFKGDRIISTLRELIGEYNIEDLPISFTAVAADIETEKEVWFSKGSLFDAIRASIATPTLFTPFESNGRTILDGGLVNPVPIAPTLRDQTDITIAVNLSGKEKLNLDTPVIAEEDQSDKTTYRHSISHFIEGLYKKKEKSEAGGMGLTNIVTKSIETMQNTIARFKLASYTPDIIIEIPKNACGFFEFERAEEMIALGRKNAYDTISPLSSNKGR